MQEVLVTQRDWMAMYLGWVLQGRWKELGNSVHVLRRVDNFLERHFSMDSEVGTLVFCFDIYIYFLLTGLTGLGFSTTLRLPSARGD